jgi:hypothetical protein
MKGINVIWRGRKNFSVTVFGLCNPAGVVMSERNSQSFAGTISHGVG